MMYSRALLVYNQNAGQQETLQQLAAVIPVLAKNVKELVLYQTFKPGEGEAVCRDQGGTYDLILIMGGDGSVHECVNGIATLDHPPLVGILPVGTCNDFARSMNLPVELALAADELMKGHVRELDIGMAQGRVFTNFFGVGLITDTSENINPDLKGKLGKLSYFISMLQTVRAAEPFSYSLEYDGHTSEGEAVMIYISNGRYLGTRPLPFTLDSLCDGLLDVLIIREAGLPLLKELLSRKVEGEWKPANESIEYVKAASVKLTTAKPMKADTDGEVYMEAPADVSVRPRGLRFLVGGE
ncbi:diacylglycerol kinase catalytic region [Paenibacillus vortex V453]|uniref:Diacylglycerol kinase catalytic region n=1 Tax=Paenibacillus vortex V453 TaxID=715225 RepID=A0A2R9T1Z3_9BACL|nr:diacylglycerol kinase family protein [Paenibacillus vortex]EFU43607.1 diacylglycerol kinase catalytic region [Paenibacillus vortex V453]